MAEIELVIKIPEGLKNDFESEQWTALSCMEMKEALERATPLPKGYWIEERNDYGEIEHWHCSNCYDNSGFTTTCKWDYCPSCGADMRGEEK